MTNAPRSRRKPAPKPPPDQPHMIGYARVSMADQSPRLQIDALLAAGVDPRDIYEEKAQASGKRPQFEAMLKDAREGDIVVVWKLDRLGRSVRQVHATIDRLAAQGASVRVLTQHIDTSTPAGRLMLTMLAAVAEMERDLIRERTAAGLAAARARGIVGGRKPKVTDEQVRDARRRFNAGEDLSSIAEEYGVQRQTLYKRFRQADLIKGAKRKKRS